MDIKPDSAEADGSTCVTVLTPNVDETVLSPPPRSSWLSGFRESRKLVLIVVATALFLDSTLLTSVVPIIPEYLYELRHKADGNQYQEAFEKEWAATATAPTDISELPKLAKTISAKSRHDELVEVNVNVGVLFASKAFTQLITSAFMGPITARFGYVTPMTTGFVILFVSAILFAFGESYKLIFIARAIQGIGASCMTVSGMGMLAERYPDNKQRGNAMAIAFGGFAAGILFGPSFGRVMYQFWGKSATFSVLALDIGAAGLLHFVVLHPTRVQPAAGAPYYLGKLLMDPHIIIAAGALMITHLGIAMLESSLPIWMMDTMNAKKWERGGIFRPASISYLAATYAFGPLGHRFGRWIVTMIGFLVTAICFLCIPLAQTFMDLIIPMMGIGCALGMVFSSMMPELGRLVDTRHALLVYGSVYAIGDFASCLPFVFGPSISEELVQRIGFEWMLVGIALVFFAYSPFLLILRNRHT